MANPKDAYLILGLMEDEIHQFGDAPFYSMRARILAALGNYNEAIDLLFEGWSRYDTGLRNILVDPFFDPLRKETRFQELLATIGLAD